MSAGKQTPRITDRLVGGHSACRRLSIDSQGYIWMASSSTTVEPKERSFTAVFAVVF